MAITTTVATAVAAFKTCLDGVLSADPASGYTRIRKCFWGQGAPTEQAIPFLAAQILHQRSTGMAGVNNSWEIWAKLKILTHIKTSDSAVADLIVYATQVNNLLYAWLPTVGVEGGEKILWAYTVPDEPSQGKDALAEAEVYFKVNTTRASN